MSLFGRKYSIEESGLLQGATDYHSHILPGVDDGVRSMEKSIEVLQEYERLGIRRVWLTPHIMEDFPNEPSKLKKRFEELKARWTGTVELKLAAENMLDNLFLERFADENLLTMELPEGETLLVETSYFNPPMELWSVLDDIRKHGFRPLLAHPERYVYMGRKEYDRLKEIGVHLQLNLPSLIGGYGSEAAKKAAKLLADGAYERFGSDIHRLSAFQSAIEAKVLSKKQIEALEFIKQ